MSTVTERRHFHLTKNGTVNYGTGIAPTFLRSIAAEFYARVTYGASSVRVQQPNRVPTFWQVCNDPSCTVSR